MEHRDRDQVSPGSHLDDFGRDSSGREHRIPYMVINLRTDESHGEFDTVSEARGCVRYDKLTNWAIWHGNLRVEACDPPDTKDERVLQGTGNAPWELPS